MGDAWDGHLGQPAQSPSPSQLWSADDRSPGLDKLNDLSFLAAETKLFGGSK